MHVENNRELEIKKLKEYKKIGVMAGTSTPKESVQDVIKKLDLLRNYDLANS